MCVGACVRACVCMCMCACVCVHNFFRTTLICIHFGQIFSLKPL